MNDKQQKIHLTESQEAVVIFGEEGTGKSTVATLLSGGNLVSIRKNGQFVIIDDNSRIATDSKAKTLVPEMFTCANSSMVLYDCPDFGNNGKTEDGIVMKYFLNKLFGHLKSVKFVFVISYQSFLDDEEFNKHFENLIRQATSLLQNIEKFRDGIGLIVTKVDNNWNVNDNGSASLENNDIEVLEAIKGQLNRLKSEFEHKNEDSNILSDDRKYRGEAIKFLDILIGTNNTNYTKISIFRKPIREGLMNNLGSFENDKNAIDALVNYHLHFIQNETIDLWNMSYSIDADPEESLVSLVGEIMRERLDADIVGIAAEIKRFYLNKVQSLYDLEILSDMMGFAYQAFAEINDKEPQMFLKQILNTTKVLNIDISADVLRTINKDIKIFDSLTMRTGGENITLITANMIGRFNESLQHLKDSEKWYQFLIDVQETLSRQTFEDEMSKAQDPKYYGEYAEKFVNKHTHEIDTDTYNLTLWASEGGVEHLLVNSFEYERYLTVLREFFNDKMEYICSSDKLIVKGFNVWYENLNKVAEPNDCWWNVDRIELFALNRFDMDTAQFHANLQHFAIAPKLEKDFSIHVPDGVEVHPENITIVDSNNNSIGS